MKRCRSLIVLLAAAFAGAVPASAQDTVELPATMDGTLYEDPAGTLANGSGQYLFAGFTQQALQRRALVAFDVAGTIPAGSTILSAELTLEASKVASADNETVLLHRVTESWGEGASDAPGEEGEGTAAAPGDATWIHRMSPGTMWMEEGGSFVLGPSDIQQVGGLGSYTWGSTPGLVADVQGWLDDPSSNFGWILMIDGGPGSAKRFNSRENGTASTRPLLRVEYMSGGPQPPTAGFTWSPQSPVPGQQVQFTDQSTGSPTSWVWDFDDGATSTDQNPTHTFTDPGTYTVSLSVANADGSDSVSHDVTVTSGGGDLEVSYLLAAAAKAAGAAGAFFLTDLDIQNGGSSTASYQFLWLERGANNASPMMSAVFTVEPGEAVRFRDVLGEVFGFAGGAVGALAIASDSEELRMMSRTYNQTTEGGTFGQAIPGVRTDRLLMAGQRARILFFTENADFRSNLGLANGSGDPIRIMWERFAPDGTSVDTGMIDLPPWGNDQLNRVFSDLQPVEAAYIDVWTPTTGGLFAAYGSVLDNPTSDPTTVLPQ